ncbi:FkbM family methyltransferase [Erythrobacter arachoides]|uniref:FkbM family methyltransferase n=1 Tax=Aurantiacibacter arachoides TaxID=1850444 RepID=A0A845A0V8_9SPHN|nr:FkbM family methyltransferase [Aurantiacibacter arachoides]MXO93354.1 FkbM family methyltransferase [Aurantiacibacter arachoides]GGD50050.1 hypothetical protein GCM10011411_07280 [Aurantiacibacter arachoides]
MNRETIERLPNFLKRFGMRHGLRLGLGLPSQGRATDIAALAHRTPGFDRPIWLRPNRSDYSIFWQTMVNRQYDLARFPQTAELERRAEAMLATGKVPVIVDAGANIGLSLRAFAAKYPFAHVVAIEPDADNMRVLEANLAAAGGAHTAVLGGVASRSGHCRVISYERGSAGLQTEYCDAAHPDAVRALTVDECVALVPDGEPWIVKLDIEGAQDELFSGDTGWVGRTDLILLELDDWAFPWSGSSITFFQALAQHRFDYLLNEELILAFRHTD